MAEFSEKELAYMDTLDDHQRAIWMAARDTWILMRATATAAHVQGMINHDISFIREWDDLPRVAQQTFADKVRPYLAAISLEVGAVCLAAIEWEAEGRGDID